MTSRPQLPHWIVEAALMVLAAVDACVDNGLSSRAAMAAAVVACAAVAFRGRRPLLAFALTLPALALTDMVIAPLVVLYSLATQSRNRLLLTGCVIVQSIAAAFLGQQQHFATTTRMVVNFVYVLAWGAAPVLLGQLVRARDELARRLIEIEEVRDHEQQLHAQAVLARERAQIGREMHDVVSHQVSLIAVRAATLMVATSDPDTRDAARTIRTLSVRTLDELRHLVTLLRAAGGRGTELTPQPTLADLHTLIASCGISVELSGALPADITGAAQRAVYRTAQEALTNVRKHAYGATATVELWSTADEFGVIIANTPATSTAIPLPGSGHGLIGLGERAELLDGKLLSGPTADGGFCVELRLPRR